MIFFHYFPKDTFKGRKFHRRKGGTSIVEVIFYSVVLVILLLTVTGTFITMRNAYSQMKYSTALQNSAVVSIDRIEREIRDSTSVDTANSTFSINPGVLTLVSKDDAGVAQTLQFYVLSGILRMKKNTVDIGPLTDQSVTVSNLIFRRLSNSHSEAIKIELTLSDTSPTMNRNDKYYSTIIVGGSL